MDSRLQSLEHWLKTHCPSPPLQVIPLAGDASFRRYFRILLPEGSLIAMDAPPPRENVVPFVAIADMLRQKGLSAPKVFASDLQQGFLLLTDFGDDLYLKTLTSSNALTLYDNALDALSILQSSRRVSGWDIPFFTAEFMYQELQLFKEWFLLRHLGLSLSHETEDMLAEFFHFLAEEAASQPQVFMHRDFHSANLLVLPDSDVGILDFQDAFIGPVTYDLVSLLRDCYIAWPDALVKKLVLSYKEKISEVVAVSDEGFLRWFDLMGLQRHLKALLTFSRKFHRDGSANYLQHIPRTLHYIASASAEHKECAAFNAYLTNVIMPALEKVSLSCAQ
ncbi:MAG: phosphotransferase [Gammaproteobacteria bacterium]|nr:phosphotransferase [Gammaproteobacteria bacterium]